MLAITHLRFTCQAITPVDLPAYRAGGQLRGALGNVMRRAYCPEACFGNGKPPTPEHVAVCPVCWLMAANEHPGEERRGYALWPPVAYAAQADRAAQPFAPGERFDFGLSLYGDTLRLLPYFLLTVAEVGREGVGLGRGTFALRQVCALDPLLGGQESVLAEGESLIHTPSLQVGAAQVQAATQRVLAQVGRTGRLGLRFHTPMRLVADEQLVKAPDFGVLFTRLLERIDQLERQYAGGGRRDEAERQGLLACANRVRLAEARTQWVEIRSGSTRRGEPSWISGFVGEASYLAPVEVWQPLLPWLVWGQLTQVGKDVVKGNGAYQIA
jgi:hypothetical protein